MIVTPVEPIDSAGRRETAANTCVVLTMNVAVTAGGIMLNKIKQQDRTLRTGQKLWYLAAAENTAEGWEKAALPLGNGHLGAMIFGGIKTEEIQLNEKTLWSGGLHVQGSTGGNSGGEQGAALLRVRKLLDKGDTKGATKAMNGFLGDEIGLGAYQNFGSLFLEFAGDDVAASYVRDLDLETAQAGVSFTQNYVEYQRNYFISYPDNVLVAKLDASKAGSLHFTASIQSAQNAHAVAQDATITITGTVKDTVISGRTEKNDTPLRFAAALHILPVGGSVTANADGSLMVRGADSVVLFFTAKTDYANVYPDYRSGENPLSAVQETMVATVQKGYDAILSDHLADYQEIYRRVQLDIGQKEAGIPTDQMLRQYREGQHTAAVEALYFQYGRYLLIASSRAGNLPANLQGIWNNSNTPVWQSDYHLNVNLQMNYWPAYVTNLAETALPLVEYVESLRIPGRVTAKQYVDIGETLADGRTDVTKATGWMVHTQNNPLGHTGPGSSWNWGWSPSAGAWLTQNTYEYYQFTGDVEYLAEKIYPAMEESARLWSQLLVYDETRGCLISSPSYSPEHGTIAKGTTYDHTLVWQLYRNVLEAAEILQSGGYHTAVDNELIPLLQAQLPHIQPLEVGRWGQIKEWHEEDAWRFRGRIKHHVQKGHRHMSHLLGLYPGNQITQDTPEYFAAAQVSLQDRGDAGTGWSKAQKICAWARLQNGNHSYKMLQEILKVSTLPNLWDTHPPFQIDGNFGAAAGIAEMLLQSHCGYISLLPALPDRWRNGAVRGLVARGNFTVDITWKDAAMTAASLMAAKDGICRIQLDAENYRIVDTNQHAVLLETKSGVVSFATKAGQIYQVMPK